ITHKGFADPTAGTRLASSVTVTYDASVSEVEGGGGQAAGRLTAKDGPTQAASPVGSRHPTTKLMAARAAGRQAIRIAHLRVHEEWHVSIGTVSRKMSRRGYRAGATSPASITLCCTVLPSIF